MVKGKSAAWLESFRLRTLPLSATCVILGSFLALHSGKFSIAVFIMAFITTESLQILSNLANDYGDLKSGADSNERIGPERALQKGDISLDEMKRMILFFVLLSAVSGILLVWFGTRGISFIYTLFFILAGAGAIAAAIKYTVGKKPYGYRALGDLFVFIFFGIAGTAGTFFLHTNVIEYKILLPATTAGMMSVAVLNLNNMRDMESDIRTGKITLAAIMGRKGAVVYHTMLFISALAASSLYSIVEGHSLLQMLYLAAFIPFLINVLTVIRCKEPALLDGELKKVSAAAIMYSIFFGAALILT